MSQQDKKHEQDSTPATYKIKVDDKTLNITESEPSGRYIMEKLGLDSTKYFLVLSLPSRPDVMIEADDTFDAAQPGIEHLIVVTRIKQYSFHVDESRFVLDKPNPTGRELLKMVGKAPCRYALVQVIANADDQFIDSDEEANLRLAGTEQFNSVLKDEVTVTISHDDKEVSVILPRGTIQVAVIKQKAGISNGYSLYAGEPPQPLVDTANVTIEGCETFFTQVNSGASS